MTGIRAEKQIALEMSLPIFRQLRIGKGIVVGDDRPIVEIVWLTL